VLLASLNDTPKKYSDLSSGFSTVYEELQQAPIHKNYSPTIKFSFVPPPNVDNSTLLSIVQEEDDEAFFTTVRSTFGENKPLAVYLPGLDCAGISGVQQFHDLSSSFEFWRMSVSTTDRSSFSELSDKVVSFLEEVSNNGSREVTLIGESFGGLLAPIVALKMKSRRCKLNGLVMVNPATSFDSTNWDQLGPLLSSLKVFQEQGATGATPYTVVGGIVLSRLIPDSQQFQRILELFQGVQIPPLSSSTIPEILEAMNEGFGILGKQLPADLVSHRVSQWMPVGAQLLTDKRLATLDLPTLIVAGEEDSFLPSKDEADRLTSLIPKSKKIIVKGSGHFVLDDRVNLTEAIIYSNIDPLNLNAVKYDPITDWKLPNDEEIRNVIENRIKPLRKLTSPVWFSSDSKGVRWKGLQKIPSEGPIVFVANHQLFGLDLGMIIAQLIEERDITVRGLAHPVIFAAENDEIPGQPDSPGIVEKPIPGGLLDNRLLQKFGAIKVTPRNYYRVLQSGQNVLLFPGGTREVFHGKDEAYKLFWPETPDFVKTAARFNATIIPLSAVGAADSVDVLVDAPDMVKLPFGIGERIANQSKNITSARFNKENDEELFVAPLIVPKLPPARHYFIFGKPFGTQDVDHKDADQVGTLYKDVKRELERGFEDILRSREDDPSQESVQRIVLEQLTGKQAPTFSVEKLNEK